MPKPKTVLAIDTVHSNYSIAIIQSSIVLSEIYITNEEKPSEKIIELIEVSLKKLNINIDKLDSIAVGVGPGNFTGIRVGISVAKGIAFALNIKCYGVSRFQTLLINDCPTLAIINIKNDLYYSQMFKKQKPLSDPIEQNLSSILKGQYSNDTIISGDCALRISEKLNLNCGKQSSFSKASEIGLIATKSIEPNTLIPSPLYVKGHEAELPKEPPPKYL